MALNTAGEETLRLDGMTKTFPGVQACQSISLSIRKGEIHALLGENGAGKSTLVKMIYGLLRPDAGTMLLDGMPYRPDVLQARDQGVAMVFQHFSLFEALTVKENIMLSDASQSMGGLAERIRSLDETYGLSLQPDQIVGDLSAGERQRVEIVRCLLQDLRLLIMDEPTSVLTQLETKKLFETLRKLAAEGVAIIYISHKLEEVRQLCDRATIIRGGKVVATCDAATETAKSLAEMMVGSELVTPARSAGKPGLPCLRTEGLCIDSGSQFGTDLADINLEVREGEIFGIAGVAGNGQDELMAALSGERMPGMGTIWLRDDRIETESPDRRRQRGLVTAPEQRNGHAASTEMSLVENALLTGRVRKSLTRQGVVDWPAARAFAEEIIARFDVRCAGVAHAAQSLSGGNLQKFLIGREILQQPDILIINQPTWGVDAKAANAIRQALLNLADSGSAVLVISQDLDEILEIADRIAVLRDGMLSVPHAPSSMSRIDFGLLMTGTEASHAGA